MSVQANTYIMRGALFGYSEVEAKVAYEQLEPYMDSAFKGVRMKDGICVLSDGMNGKYVAVGQVIAKTRDHEGFEEPHGFADHSFGENKDRVLKEKIENLIGLEAEIEWLVLTHYR